MLFKDPQGKIHSIEEDFISMIPEGSVPVTEEEIAAMESTRAKTDLINQAYLQMNSDVYAQMSLVFGTNNSESASAYNETFKLMKESPADFIGVLGLQTEAEILATANAKLAEIKAYALWRMGRIEQFKAERAVILAN